MIKPWRVERSVVTYQDCWLTLRSDDCRNSSGHPIAPYHVLELPTWLNIVALTPEYKIVLVTEYRHGAGEILTSLPSGTVDPEDSSIYAAARRELLEETGYGGGRLVTLGRHPANPANQTNDVVAFLAIGVEKITEQSLDSTEEIDVSAEDYVVWLQRACRMEVRVQVSHIAAALLAAQLIVSGQLPELDDLRQRLVTG